MKIIGYVDGSYSKEKDAVGCGMEVCIFDNSDKLIHKIRESWIMTDKSLIKHKNVAGEIEAAKKLMRLAYNKGADILIIRYDYEGIKSWCTGDWAPRTKLALDYIAEYIKRENYSCEIKFEKIPAHTGANSNKIADKLAREVLLEEHLELQRKQ